MRPDESGVYEGVAHNPRAASVLTLTSFLLLESLRFSAGVFRTEYGRRERKNAQHSILYDGGRPDAQPTRELLAAVPGIDPRSLGAMKIDSSAAREG